MKQFFIGALCVLTSSAVLKAKGFQCQSTLDTLELTETSGKYHLAITERHRPDSPIKQLGIPLNSNAGDQFRIDINFDARPCPSNPTSPFLLACNPTAPDGQEVTITNLRSGESIQKGMLEFQAD